jgi:hypothetical protein
VSGDEKWLMLADLAIFPRPVTLLLSKELLRRKAVSVFTTALHDRTKKIKANKSLLKKITLMYTSKYQP